MLISDDSLKTKKGNSVKDFALFFCFFGVIAKL